MLSNCGSGAKKVSVCVPGPWELPAKSCTLPMTDAEGTERPTIVPPLNALMMRFTKVPLIVPVAGSNVSPAGRLPLMLKVVGSVTGSALFGAVIV